MNQLLIATKNHGKFEEIREYLKLLYPNVQFRSLHDFPNLPPILEDGSSFVENARKKAKLAASFSKLPTLADDSGLEVTSIGGRPGVLSARFAGPHATDEENINKLLNKLENVPEGKRDAQFTCIMVLYAPNGHTHVATGELKGAITETLRGTNGFGYDPIFFVPSVGRTLAEMTIQEKNRMSHRAIALEKISKHLGGFLKKV